MTGKESLCECGHPFDGNHRTPGTECSALDCECGLFKAAPSLRGAHHRRSIIDDARLCYEAHWDQMLISYPHLRMTPWDDQDAAVREAWIEHITPEDGRTQSDYEAFGG